MFKCPKCGEMTTVYARKHTKDNVYGRYRMCNSCGYKFSTIERSSDDVDKVYSEGYKDALIHVTDMVGKEIKNG